MRTLVVEEHSDGRRCGVVELARPDSPEKRPQKSDRHGAAGRDEEDQHAHAGTRRLRARVPPMLIATIVSELTGIRMAATSGVRAPSSASVRPTAL